jgi:hypothetical protein
VYGRSWVSSRTDVHDIRIGKKSALATASCRSNLFLARRAEAISRTLGLFNFVDLSNTLPWLGEFVALDLVFLAEGFSGNFALMQAKFAK